MILIISSSRMIMHLPGALYRMAILSLHNFFHYYGISIVVDYLTYIKIIERVCVK